MMAEAKRAQMSTMTIYNRGRSFNPLVSLNCGKLYG